MTDLGGDFYIQVLLVPGGHGGKAGAKAGHMLCVMQYASHLPCRVSNIDIFIFSPSYFFFFFFCKSVELVSGGSVINKAYPV